MTGSPLESCFYSPHHAMIRNVSFNNNFSRSNLLREEVNSLEFEELQVTRPDLLNPYAIFLKLDRSMQESNDSFKNETKRTVSFRFEGILYPALRLSSDLPGDFLLWLEPHLAAPSALCEVLTPIKPSSVPPSKSSRNVATPGSVSSPSPAGRGPASQPSIAGGRTRRL